MSKYPGILRPNDENEDCQKNGPNFGRFESKITKRRYYVVNQTLSSAGILRNAKASAILPSMKTMRRGTASCCKVCRKSRYSVSEKGDTTLNYANIKYCDIANGTGVRTSLFVSGCRRHCENCFNKVAWDFDYGKPFDKAIRNEILASLKPDYINGLSLLGGEPFEPENQRALVSFLHDVRILYPHKTIWCYTGNVYETELLQPSASRCEVTDEMLSYIDVLVDGAFVQESVRHLAAVPGLLQPAHHRHECHPRRGACGVVAG